MWDNEWALNDLDLADVCDAVLLDSESGSTLTDSGISVPGRDGVVLDPEAPYGPLTFSLITFIRLTDDDGLVVHGDGPHGHFYENLDKIQLEFSKQDVVLSRDAPSRGKIETPVRLISKPVVDRSNPHQYAWPLTGKTGAWRDSDPSTDTGNPPDIITLGTRRIDDPIVELSALGVYKITDAEGVEYTITAASGPDYPITIDVGAGTVVDDSAADARGDVVFSHRAWLRLSPSHTHAVTSAAACTVTWHNRWA